LTETGATLFGAEIRNLLLLVDEISALGLSTIVDVLALASLSIKFEGLIILASALTIANGRASLKSNLLLAELLLF